ncbi:glutamate racemase [Bacterioplanes sanyensis]|uniref:Glutamate racemase n=1 Tax=Bacterioplanes sanyensis TaxID=1249553 RepID=A0A222FK00_9GAMM|nr:glutamate racemase [Bacterioplanes sanyensis]ASP39375.1 glutamate racemase [Bacterioplanes sanyensis]
MANILVFDSGVGGLSVAQHIAAQHRHASIIYLMDRQYFPYGQLDDQRLCSRVLQLCQAALANWPIDLIVIACNTASTLALPTLRAQLPVPIVGVVPAIKVAAERAGSSPIGLLATQATVQRDYLSDLIATHAPNHSVHRLGSAELVQWSEQWVYQQHYASGIHELLSPWINEHGLRHVVLGCTHFPLLTPQLQRDFPGVDWIDSGEAIARRVGDVLANQVTSIAKSDTTEVGSLCLSWAGEAPDHEALRRFLVPWERAVHCQPLQT